MNIDRFTQAALDMPGKYDLKGPFIAEAAAHARSEQQAKGRELSTDHLKQIIVKWCKATADKRAAFWAEFHRKPTRGEWEETEQKRLGYWGYRMLHASDIT